MRTSYVEKETKQPSWLEHGENREKEGTAILDEAGGTGKFGFFWFF